MVENIANLVATVEGYRLEANQHLDPKTQTELGQFMTPASVAEFMASLFCVPGPQITLLDPGAGVGSLTAAFVARQLGNGLKLQNLTVDTYELDSF
ncbi:MAG: hypothetical protein R2867_34125 [Caldilineaceae bacterium]